MAEIFALGFLENLKILFVGILIYAIVYAVLKKINILSDDPKINSLVAALSAIIVSFSGVVTYSISYAINWFVIILFIVFLLMVILMFLGVKFDDIASVSKKNSKSILIAFGILFSIILLKSFFALNNTFDTTNPPYDPYLIDTSFNTGVNDLGASGEGSNWFWMLWLSIDRDLLAAVLFLIIIGVFVMIIGK